MKLLAYDFADYIKDDENPCFRKRSYVDKIIEVSKRDASDFYIIPCIIGCHQKLQESYLDQKVGIGKLACKLIKMKSSKAIYKDVEEIFGTVQSEFVWQSVYKKEKVYVVDALVTMIVFPKTLLNGGMFFEYDIDVKPYTSFRKPSHKPKFDLGVAKDFKVSTYMWTDRVYFPFEEVTNLKIKFTDGLVISDEERWKYDSDNFAIFDVRGQNCTVRVIPSVDFDYAYILKRANEKNERVARRVNYVFNEAVHRLPNKRGHFHSDEALFTKELLETILKECLDHCDGVKLLREIWLHAIEISLSIDYFGEKVSKVNIEGKYVAEENFDCVDKIKMFNYEEWFNNLFKGEERSKIGAMPKRLTDAEIDEIFEQDRLKKVNNLNMKIKEHQESLKSLRKELREVNKSSKEV